MNKFLCTLIVLVGFATISYSQSSMTLANSEGKVALMESKVSGEYIFTMPERVDQAMVEKNSAFYVAYFSVAFDETSKVTKINMVENEAQSRIVIARFLTSCGVREIQIDEQEVNMTDFITNYLN